MTELALKRNLLREFLILTLIMVPPAFAQETEPAPAIPESPAPSPAPPCAGSFDYKTDVDSGVVSKLGTMVSHPCLAGDDSVSGEGREAVDGFNGIAWVGVLPANGKREVIVLLPASTDVEQPLEVLVLFHGAGGSGANMAQWLRSYIEQLPDHQRNVLVVIPTSGDRRSWDARWMAAARGESLTALQDQAVRVAGQITGMALRVGSYTVGGFSGGGSAIANAARSGQLRAGKVNFFDANFGNWGDVTVRYRKPGTLINVFYTDQNRANAMRLRGKPGVHLEASVADHGGTVTQYFFR